MGHLVDQAIIETGLVRLEERVVEAVPDVVDLGNGLWHFNLKIINSDYGNLFKSRALIKHSDFTRLVVEEVSIDQLGID